LSVDQIGHQCRQAIVVALQPVVLDCHVLTFDVAGIDEAFTECDRSACGGIGRPDVDKPDRRQRPFLSFSTVSTQSGSAVCIAAVETMLIFWGARRSPRCRDYGRRASQMLIQGYIDSRRK
jgi:hypothetical protein